MYGRARETGDAAAECGALAQVDPLAVGVQKHLQRRADTQLHFQSLTTLPVAGVAQIRSRVGLPDGGDDEGAVTNYVSLSSLQGGLVTALLMVHPPATSAMRYAMIT
jgi:hypothetical protein